MKTAVILDSEPDSTHSMEPVLDRRGFVVMRAGTAEETIALLTGGRASADLVIVEVPLRGSTSQTEAAVRIQRSSPDIPILLISNEALDQWSGEDFLGFGQLLSGRVDLLVKPLSQASFMSKVHALIYNVSYVEPKRLFDSVTARRAAAAGV